MLDRVKTFCSIRASKRSVALAAFMAVFAFAISTCSAQARTTKIQVPPQFFGHHLMFNSNLNPLFPVHANRLGSASVDWCDLDTGTASNQYNFWQLDNLFNQAQRNGITELEYTFADTPAWAVTGSYPQPSASDQCASTSTSNPWNPPANESYWTNFVTALVNHSKGKIHAYELWNEADYQYYWSGSVQQMVQMSVDAAKIIHSIDPSALVLSPSITNTSEGYSWLKQYLSSLPLGTINAIAVHSYTGGAWPEDSVPAQMNSVRAALPAAYAGTPIWSTEGGWGQNSQFSSDPSWQRGFVARYDLQMLTQRLVRNYWYAYPNTQWGTLFDGSNLTQAGIATNTVQNWLVGATLTPCSTRDGNVWTCNLTTAAGKSAELVWAKSWAVWMQTPYATAYNLSGGSSPTNGWVQANVEPVLLQ